MIGKMLVTGILVMGIIASDLGQTYSFEGVSSLGESLLDFTSDVINRVKGKDGACQK